VYISVIMQVAVSQSDVCMCYVDQWSEFHLRGQVWRGGRTLRCWWSGRWWWTITVCQLCCSKCNINSWNLAGAGRQVTMRYLQQFVSSKFTASNQVCLLF